MTNHHLLQVWVIMCHRHRHQHDGLGLLSGYLKNQGICTRQGGRLAQDRDAEDAGGNAWKGESLQCLLQAAQN
jgi:hypothetical protein